MIRQPASATKAVVEDESRRRNMMVVAPPRKIREARLFALVCEQVRTGMVL